MTAKTTILLPASTKDLALVKADINALHDALHAEVKKREVLQGRVDDLEEKLNRVQTQRSLRR